MLSVYLILSLCPQAGQTFHRYWGPMTWRSQAYVRGKCNNQVKVHTHESLPVRALWESELSSRVKQTWWIPISYYSPLPGTSSSCPPISPNPTNYSGPALMPKSHLLWEAFLYPHQLANKLSVFGVLLHSPKSFAQWIANTRCLINAYLYYILPLLWHLSCFTFYWHLYFQLILNFWSRATFLSI